jgi:phosphogluconate 2-dehydrogenase/gluconate 2-dehydrogenase
MRKHVVAYKELPEDLLAALRREFELTCFDGLNEDNRPRFEAALRGAHGLIGASVRFDRQAFADAPNLEVISTVSVGYDTFDVPSLSARGIALANTPDVLTETTADTIFTLILASARRAVELAEFVKAGRWRKSIGEDLYGVDVHSKTLGFVGMGRIGSAIARRAHLGFNMRVLYHDRKPVPAVDEAYQATRLPLDDVLARSDFVCVVLPLTADTEKLIGAREFALMKPGAIFINGSRGRIVDEAALIDALQRGQIRGAGLDVFEREPLAPDSPLLGMSNAVCLPHIGSATHETRYAMASMAVDNLVTGLRGERPKHLVNPEAWASRHP